MLEPLSGAARKYQTLRRLAVGGMGEIFLAREEGRLGFSRLVVIKRMLPQHASDAAGVEMFVDEARIVGHLHHPNICQILELGEEDGMPFLALEYVRGQSLSAMWDRARARKFTVSRAVTLQLLADTARALHFAHEATDADGAALNVIHRDISPHNVMVSYLGDVKLMDFGIARADNRQHRTDTGKIKGKIAYMSPEQLRGGDLDRRTDIFSVGVMLWELTLARRLFGARDEVETLRRAAACEVPRPRTIDPEYPEALEDIVMRTLAREREDRIASAGELARLLGEQAQAAGGADRAAIAKVVQELFAEESARPEEVAETQRLDVGPSTIVDPPPSVVVPASEGRPTVPLRAESPPPEAIAPTVPAAPALTPPIAALPPLPPPAPPRRRSPLVALTALVAATGAIAGVMLGSSPDAPSARAAEVAVIAPDAVVMPDAAIVMIDAAVVSEAVVVVVPDAAPAPDHRRVRTGNGPVAGKPPVAAPPVVPVASEVGTLAVSSTVVGVVLVDGHREKTTPFQTPLAPGPHDVAVELAEGAGTVRTRTRVDSGKKTKCRADAHAVVCEPAS